MSEQPKQDSSSFYRDMRQLYDAAYSEMTIRQTHKELGFDEMDKLYRSHIQKEKWPFASRIFTPIAFSALLKKDTRLFAANLTGRLVSMDEGGELAAMIGTEVLHAQWEDVDFHDTESMLKRWFRTSQNARKRGLGWMWVPWKKEKGFDGPTAIPYDNKDVLTLSGSTDPNDGVFLIDYPLIDDLYAMNDSSSGGEMYKKAALDELKTMQSSDDREQISVARSLAGLGSRVQDSNNGEKTRRIQLVKYRTRSRWVDFVPTQGGEQGEEPYLILRDIPNPYDHGQVPLIPLCYYPIDDDIYGVSELEPIRSMQKALNALVCNFMDTVNLDLMPIMKGSATDVQWNTIEYKPRAIWLMNNPTTDLVRLESGNSTVAKFVEVYKVLVGAMNEALGESTGEASIQSAAAADKTATEVKDTALLRSARDNFNRLAIKAAMAKMVYYWWEMDKQFLDSNKVVRISGIEAIEYFINEGLHDFELSTEGYEYIEEYMGMYNLPFDEAYERLRQLGELDQFAQPLHAIAGKEGKVLPKLSLDRSGKTGFLTVNKSDFVGHMRYIPDIEAMSLPDDQTQAAAFDGWFSNIREVEQALVQNGDAPRYKDLLIKQGEKLKIQDAERFFGAGGGLAPTTDMEQQGQEDPALAGQVPPEAMMQPQGGQMTAANIPVQPVMQPNVPQL